mmetsp:Transcript_95302/g.226993  ORF Transcript_95302/g.226993 Transcript_95302/m.226993 type:complete len:264 (+) Transcript_95302:1309-2100(+)
MRWMVHQVRRWGPVRMWHHRGPPIKIMGRWHPGPTLALALALAALHDLPVDFPELLPPNLNRLYDIVSAIGIVVDHEVHSRVLIDLPIALHATACQRHLFQARCLPDLLHGPATGSLKEHRHVGTIHIAASIDAALGLRETNVKALLLLGLKFATAGYGRGRGALELVFGDHGMIVAIEDDVRHSLGLLLPTQQQNLLHVGRSKPVQMLPQISFGADLGKAPDEDLQVRRHSVLVVRQVVRPVRHLDLVDVHLLRQPATVSDR